MQLPADLGSLTYCLNIHRTQTWDEIREALNGPVTQVKAAVCPDRNFAVGLRFSRQALDDLADPVKRSELKAVMSEQGFDAATVNGFPYGSFHGTKVKEDVYQPDWRADERVAYTNDLADLMAELNTDGDFVSLSTVPGTFKPLAKGAETLMAQNILRAVAHCIDLEQRTGVCVALAIEPEPFCFLETIDETVAFFRDYLFSADAVRFLSALTGATEAAAQGCLPRHLGLCYDVCHAAVEFKSARDSISALRDAGIPVHKLQLSAALRVERMDAAAREALAAYAEPTYLHQVMRMGANGRIMHADLPEALALGSETDGEEWRVHFHVPIFMNDLGAFTSTRAFLEEVLDLHRESPISSHLEVETYTWDVLPTGMRGSSVDKDITRELNWVQERLTA